ncbi:hypothetical protein BKA65DRAFT_485914 [Rhexocercosporidium sp. MPI-PUGE-AT-0058]|nr:hypothetical protein BKA65DRAFT_485914 [Rhexocercosporidium sp. MPI-PUGE-AT-0058]
MPMRDLTLEDHNYGKGKFRVSCSQDDDCTNRYGSGFYCDDEDDQCYPINLVNGHNLPMHILAHKDHGYDGLDEPMVGCKEDKGCVKLRKNAYCNQRLEWCFLPRTSKFTPAGHEEVDDIDAAENSGRADEDINVRIDIAV